MRSIRSHMQLFNGGGFGVKHFNNTQSITI